MGMGRRGVRFLEEGREWKLPVLFYADDLEEEMRAMVGHFAELCSRRGLKVNASKSKVTVLNGE